MVRLTRLNGTVVHVNADLIATVEEHHDTVVGLVDGKTFVVQESAATVVGGIVAYRGAVLAAAGAVPVPEVGGAQLVVLPTPADDEDDDVPGTTGNGGL